MADDCGPQGLFHSSCHGYWTCESSSCVYYCGAPPSPGCDYNGAHYAAGDVFPSSDGCNECTCGTDGTVACTERACACDPASEPSRHYIGTPEECTRISYLCAPGTHPFSNACGCGCEDD